MVNDFVRDKPAHSCNGDKQAKAQAELDWVTENGARLPDYEDEENLPDISALLKEVMRFCSLS